VTSIAFSPDGTVVAVGYGDGYLGLINVSSQSWLAFSLVHSDAITALAFSPDGASLATCSYDGTISFCETSNAQILTIYTLETGPNSVPSALRGGPSSIQYSPDGKFFYYGRIDGTVCCALNPYRKAIFPDHGGNTGNVTVTIITPDTFPVSSSVQVTLTATGTADITGESPNVPNAHTITTTFNLAGASTGIYNLVITNPDGTTLSYPQGFTIEPGTEPQVDTNIIGWSNLRAGPYETYTVVVANQGNVDANIADLRIEVPNWLNWQIIGYEPQNIFMGDDNTSFAVQVPTIPAYGSVTVPLQLQVADVSKNAHRPFELLSWIDFTTPLLIYLGDLMEPLVLRSEDTDGRFVDVLAAQDSSGAVTAINAVRVTDTDGTTSTIVLNKAGIPVQVVGSNGAQLSIQWQDSLTAIVTPISSSGQASAPFTVTLSSPFPPPPILNAVRMATSSSGCMSCS